jgi:hypothetical protein
MTRNEILIYDPYMFNNTVNKYAVLNQSKSKYLWHLQCNPVEQTW